MPNIMLSYWYELYTRQTPAERKLEKEVARLGVRYRTQHILLSAKAILDFYFPDYNLVVEVDDKSHLRKKGIKKDQERTKRLTGLGLEVIRFTNEEVLSDPVHVADCIYSKLQTLNKVLDVNSVALGVATKRSRIPRNPKRKKSTPLSFSPQLLLSVA